MPSSSTTTALTSYMEANDIYDEPELLKRFGITPSMDHTTDADIDALAAAGSILTGSSVPCELSVAEIGQRTI